MKEFHSRFLLPFILLGLAAGCAHPPVKTARETEEDLQALCMRYDIQWQWDSVTQIVTLSKGGFRARALVGSNVVVIGGEKISVSNPLKRVRGTIVVPPDFKRKVVDPLLGKAEYALRKLRQIIIDAGHGGKDPGARGRSGTQEKVITLDIARRLQSDLEEKGLSVLMTRSRDEFISLEKRTQIASQSRADLFVSIHANSSRSRGARGMEVYYLRELDSQEKNEDQMKENQKTLFRQYAMQRNSPVLENILTDMLYSYKRGESERLARFITQKTSSTIKTQNRGSKASGFFVLRNTLIPAILVEVGFLSNPGEERLLKAGWYRQKIADGIARGLLEYADD